MAHHVRVWDLPTRIFHWFLAALVIALVLTANIGGNAMVWHMRCGYAVVSLLLFRLVWGLVGGHWSRFATFTHGPVGVWHYLRGRMAEPAGHSPLGALSVYAMLAALAVQAGAGLMADDEIAFAGPLAAKVSSAWVGRATWFHTEIGEPLVIALVVLHLCAIAYYTLLRRRTLIRPMLLGDKVLDAAAPPARDGGRERGWALVLYVLCAGAVLALVQWAG